MSQDNRISVSIPQQVIDDALANIKKASDSLKPYLQGLTEDERGSIAKMGDKSSPFVSKSFNYCGSNPEFAPNFLNVTELEKDLGTVDQLTPVLNAVSVLRSDLDDTVMLCGSEAFTGARYYYNSVSFAAKNGNTAAKPIAEDLARRFPGVKRKKSEVTGG